MSARAPTVFGGEVALLDVDGGSRISGADFAVAIVDVIEKAAHHRKHVAIAYWAKPDPGRLADRAACCVNSSRLNFGSQR